MDFNSVFHPEKKWGHVHLINSCPCRDCDIQKEYETKAIYGTIAERQYMETPETCKTCMKRLLWEIDCFKKLKWYEDRDERLKEE